MTNELKLDIEMILYDLNTVKTASEVGDNPDSFLAKSVNAAIILINQQAAELEAAKKEIERLNRIKGGVIEDLRKLESDTHDAAIREEGGYFMGKSAAYEHCIEMLSVNVYLEAAHKPEDAKPFIQHDSDCSTNNRGVPELLGACDCSAIPKLKESK